MNSQSSFVQSVLSKTLSLPALGLLVALTAWSDQEGSSGLLPVYRLPKIEDFDSIIPELVNAGEVNVVSDGGQVLAYRLIDESEKAQAALTYSSVSEDDEVLPASPLAQSIIDELEQEFAEADESPVVKDVFSSDDESDDEGDEDADADVIIGEPVEPVEESADEDDTVLDVTVGDDEDEDTDDDDDELEDGFDEFDRVFPGGVDDTKRNFTAFEEAVQRAGSISKIIDAAEEYAVLTSRRTRGPQSPSEWLTRF